MERHDLKLEFLIAALCRHRGGRSEIATLNRPFSRGRGAAADTLNGFARQ